MITLQKFRFWRTPDSCFFIFPVFCFFKISIYNDWHLFLKGHIYCKRKWRQMCCNVIDIFWKRKCLGYFHHYWVCNIFLNLNSWEFVFVRQDIGEKTLDVFRHFPWQRWWVRRPSGGGPSVSGAGQKQCRGSGTTWARPRGWRSDPGAGEGRERSCNKSPAQQGLRPGRWEVYKRDEILVESQRQSVSQAATTCLDTSRRPLAPIPVS